MDATHKTCVDGEKNDCFLYTLVVRSSATGKGAAVCWMITNSSTHHPVKMWLDWLRDDMEFTPGAIMIDNSDTEIKAIKASYGDDAKIFLCHWHILRAWRKNVVYKVRPEAGNKANQDQVKEHRKVALDHMIAIMDARTVAEYNDSLRKFKTWAWNNREKWDSGELVTYFEEEYIPKKKTWCRAYRKVTHFECKRLVHSLEYYRKTIVWIPTTTWKAGTVA